MTESDPKPAPETRAIHSGQAHNPSLGLTPPIFQTSTFKLPTAERGAELAQESAPADFYTRWGNPTTKGFEAQIASLESAEAALAVSSGMAALTILFFSHVEAGDHVVVGQSIYSGVNEIVNGVLPRYGITATTVDSSGTGAIKKALTKKTRLILVESPTNPTLDLCDLRALAEVGRDAGVTTAVDNTFATPIHQRPLEHGIDVVVHAATKYLGGHSDATGGAFCSTQEKVDRAWYYLKLFGPCLSPFEAWLFQRGMKTLPLRAERQAQSALELARFLEAHRAVDRVYYPGLESHPQHELASRQMDGYGGMLSFEVRGGHEGGICVAESLKLIQLAVSLGGVESIIQHPASMTHGTLSEKDRERAGISPALLRLSVGLENCDDLKRDLDQALSV